MNSWRTDGQGRCGACLRFMRACTAPLEPYRRSLTRTTSPHLPLLPLSRPHTTECAAGAGSFADLTYANLPAQSRGFPTTQPDGVTCAHRYYDPRTRNGSRVKGHCDTRNPRVLQHLHLDAPGCQCWTCPPGWTSDGGQASVTFCYPTVLPRYLKVEVEVNTAPPNVSVPPPFDSTNLSTADSIFTSLATTMSAPPRSVAAAQDGVSKWVGPVQRFGAVQRDTRDPAAAASYSSSYFIEGTNHRAVSVFATILTVNAAASAVATAVDAARQACMHLTGGPTACAACRNATGWDICGAVADGGMVASRPPHVLRFALSEVHRPALGHEPRKVREGRCRSSVWCRAMGGLLTELFTTAHPPGSLNAHTRPTLR